MKKFIAIAGNISSGKTTLAKIISKKLSIRMYEEPVRDNPFIDLYYKYMKLQEENPKNKKILKLAKKYSYLVQEYFFLNRVLDHKKILSYNEPMIQDRCIYEDKEIFTKYKFETRMFSLKNYLKYRALFFILAKRLKKPDLMIYLRTSTPTLKKRLKIRNNDYEKELMKKDNTYLQDLNEKYENWIPKYKGKKLVINTDLLDLKKNKTDINKIVKRVKEIVKL